MSVEALPLPSSSARPTLMPSASLNDIAYEELAGSPTEDIGEGEYGGRRELKCPWAMRGELAKRLLGYSYAADGQSFVILPHEFPDRPRATARKVHVAPFFDADVKADAGNLTRASYTHALLSVEYGVGQSDASQTAGGGEGSPELFVEESIEGFTEFLTLSEQQLHWAPLGDDPLDETEAPQLLIQGFNWIYKRMKVPVIPAAVFDLMGHVNEVEVYSHKLGYTFPVETLLYNTPTLERQINSDGIQDWTLTYRMSFRPGQWNRWYRRGEDFTSNVYKANGDRYRPYPLGDFYQLVG